MVERGSGGGVSPFGSAVKGTWRKGSLAGDPEGYVEKALETGIYSHRGPVVEPVRWLVYRRLKEE
jgi:hypothetical protein